MQAAMRKELALEKAKLNEEAIKAKETMETDLSIQMACISADAKAERLAAQQETQEGK